MKPDFYNEFGRRFYITPTIMIEHEERVVLIAWLFWSVQFYLKCKDEGTYYNLKWEYEYKNKEDLDEKI